MESEGNQLPVSLPPPIPTFYLAPDVTISSPPLRAAAEDLPRLIGIPRWQTPELSFL